MGEIRLNEGCSLRIQVPVGFTPEVAAVSRELIEFYTLPDKRGQGFAKKLLESVCKEADDAKISLLIHVKPYDGQSDSVRLQSFYAKHGFVVFQTNPTLMCRVPKVLNG
jgi:GNAT superfamily N-acetyltransferase